MRRRNYDEVYIPVTPYEEQQRFLDSRAPLNAFVTGYGGGKTLAGCIKSILLSIENRPADGLYVSPTFSVSEMTTVPMFKEILQTGGWIEGKHWKYVGGSQNYFYFPPWRGKIWIRSGSRPERLVGANLAFAGIDEPFLQSEEVYRKVIARLRRGKLRQLFLTGTPESLNWGYELLVEDPPPGTNLVQCSARRNIHLPEDYWQRLLENYPAELIRAYVEGEFVNLATNRIYYNFDPALHVLTEAEVERFNPNPALPLLWSHDFNVDPLCSVIAQKYGSELWVWDEIVLRSSAIPAAIDEFESREWSAWSRKKVLIHGDASGASRSQGESLHSCYDTLASYGYDRKMAPRSNPPLAQRHAVINGAFVNSYGARRVRIHHGCKNLIRSLNTLSFKPGTRDVNTTIADPAGHIADAFSYVVFALFNPRRRVDTPGRRFR